MDLQLSVPPSSDGVYGLGGASAPPRPGAVDADAIPTTEIANAPAVEAALIAAQASAEQPTLPEPEGKPAPAPAPAPAPPAQAAPRLRRKRRVARRRWDAPAWVVSALIHVGILGGLAAVATTSGEVIKKLADLNTSLGRPEAAEELTKIYADPSDAARTDTVGDTNADAAGSGVAFSANIGAAAPSKTPTVARAGRAISEKTGLPSIPMISAPSGLQMMPSAPSRDLGGGGKIGGDVTWAAGEVGAALDQVAREILRHLARHKVTVVWLFDESESMKDDQKADPQAKFDRVVHRVEAQHRRGDRRRQGQESRGPPRPPSTTRSSGSETSIHYELEKPTPDIDADRQCHRSPPRSTTTGTENTLHGRSP